MQCVKTAISIETSLFEEVKRLTQEMHLSRSQLVTRAIKDFVQQVRNRQLLEQINRVYSKGASREEEKQQNEMKKRHRRLVEGEW